MANKTIFLKDYQPSAFVIQRVDLIFELHPEKTRVTSLLTVQRQDVATKDLFLHGEQLTLISVILNEKIANYAKEEGGLKIFNVPDEFTLTIVTEINPQANTELTGLYISNHIFCTQCESEYFRKITYYLDRPDVLAFFTVKIIADKTHYPVLLSNGNLMEVGDLDNNQHFALWEDPFKKPSYLFALVAGDLAKITDHFVTVSGRRVALHIYSEKQNIERCAFAMSALKKSMRWDEGNYGREYDLDIFNIVAINDFIFGAMENKSLNIFNAKYILANPEVATDQDYADIDTVIAHEYFHNWSGDRVTCRDWFQLSLKEGFTIFREQSYDEDQHSAVVHRIRKVQDLRNSQFAEDAGPMAHPVRPQSYIAIDNFYTRTVYNKGGEVVRMLKTILGAEIYRRACDRYFEKFDGQAVTTDDFVDVMQEVSGRDLSQFRLWYSQAGTPVVNVASKYNREEKTLTFTFEQHISATPDMQDKQPMMIPISISLLRDVNRHETTLILEQQKQSFTFVDVEYDVVPSLNRHFSAPIKLHYPYRDEELVFLFQHDTDGFNRWEAGQCLFVSVILEDMINDIATMEVFDDIPREQTSMSSRSLPSMVRTPLGNVIKDLHSHRQHEVQLRKDVLLKAIGNILQSPCVDHSLVAELLSLPSEKYLHENVDVIDVEKISAARWKLFLEIAQQHETSWLALYHSLEKIDNSYSKDNMGKRRLKSLCLHYLVALEKKDYIQLAYQQFSTAENMTDCFSALSALSHTDTLERIEALAKFQDRWAHEPLVMNKWYAAQAQSRLSNVLDNVKRLMQQPFFHIKNPNSVYALVGGFCAQNSRQFHDISGKGYEFCADTVLTLDQINPMVAARMVEPLLGWKRFKVPHQDLMHQALIRIMRASSLSKNVYEPVSKALN